MKKKYHLLNIITIGIVVITIIVLSNLNIKTETKNIILYIVLGLALIATLILEKKINDITKKENQEKAKQGKIKFINLLENKKNEDVLYEVMYDLITEQVLEVNELMKSMQMIFEFDFIVEDNFYELDIQSEVFKRNKFNYISLCIEGEEKIFDSTFEDKDADYDIKDYSYDQIIKRIINNLKGANN